MAGAGLLALLDDIASILDDVALMTGTAARNSAGMLDDVSALTKVAAQKTAGVLGDDLALNAQQVAGVNADRELPVIFSVFRGSLLNKIILVPTAIAISAFLPQFMTPLLMIGGAYLCYEGAEKVLHRVFGGHEAPEKAVREAGPAGNAEAEERAKIQGAVRTDFILSAEIIVIALGTVPDDATLALRAMVLSAVAFAMTVGVYGLVAGIVKLDDAGLFLHRRYPEGGFGRTAGSFLLGLSPRLMRFLGIAGTIAMFLVGGGIMVHGLPWLHPVVTLIAALPFPEVGNMLLHLAFGGVAGGILVALVTLASRLARPHAR